MYLLNLSLIFVFLNTYLPFNTAPACIVKFILYWSLTFLLGAVNYSFFEKPILKFRDKIFLRSLKLLFLKVNILIKGLQSVTSVIEKSKKIRLKN